MGWVVYPPTHRYAVPCRTNAYANHSLHLALGMPICVIIVSMKPTLMIALTVALTLTLMQPWSGTAESLLLCISSMMASLVLVVDIRGFSVMGDSNVHEVAHHNRVPRAPALAS